MRLLHRGLMSVIVMRSGGVSMVVVTVVAVRRGRRVIVVYGVTVIVMAVRSRGGMVIMPMIGMGRRISVILVAVSGGRRGMTVIVMAMIGRVGGMAMVVVAGARGGRMGVVAGSGVGTVTHAMALTCAVIVVRLVLVAHCDSVPQPLFAVFAAKSV
ncbi:MAG: hypothetical protein Q8K90_05430 [Brevundimonas sp.]|nr:hypothetical protein [Brevundimonas sp.]